MDIRIASINNTTAIKAQHFEKPNGWCCFIKTKADTQFSDDNEVLEKANKIKLICCVAMCKTVSNEKNSLYNSIGA